VDLFEPSSGSQLHDNNAGILLSGLFWTVELPNGALHFSRDGRCAMVHAKDVPVIDTFQFASPFNVPATVSFRVEWEAIAPAQQRGFGKTVPATDPGAFLGTIAPARSIGQFEGVELGFSFVTNAATTDPLGSAELGRERNGAFL
jgi:hypothetical protein